MNTLWKPHVREKSSSWDIELSPNYFCLQIPFSNDAEPNFGFSAIFLSIFFWFCWFCWFWVSQKTRTTSSQLAPPDPGSFRYVKTPWIFLRILGNRKSPPIKVLIGISPNITKNWSCSNINILYTNRREILRWFQKCITLYVYFEFWMNYQHFSAKFGAGPQNGPNFSEKCL